MKKQLTKLLKHKASDEQFSGVIALWQDGQPFFEYVCGFAHRGWQIKNSMDTRFRLASISKMFTAVSILQLIDQNQLSFATSITDLLDLSQTAIPSNVTIHHLLTMSSGIADWFEESENWEGVSCRLYHYPQQKKLDVIILGNQSWCAGSLGWEIHDLIQE